MRHLLILLLFLGFVKTLYAQEGMGLDNGYDSAAGSYQNLGEGTLTPGGANLQSSGSTIQSDTGTTFESDGNLVLGTDGSEYQTTGDSTYNFNGTSCLNTGSETNCD